jgi:hypothetical protein
MAVQWVRVRTVSPTGIMPTTTIGTLTQFNGNDFPMPEYALGSLLSLIACLAAFTVYIAFKSGFVVPTLGKCIKENCKIWTGD